MEEHVVAATRMAKAVEQGRRIPLSRENFSLSSPSDPQITISRSTDPNTMGQFTTTAGADQVMNAVVRNPPPV
jgi:hypothetical protein